MPSASLSMAARNWSRARLVSGNYFPVLGVGAALGRVFTASDDLYQGGHPLAVLSYGYWKTRFAGDPGVIGRKIVVNGYPLTVIGVSQAGLRRVEPGYSPQIRVPMTMKRRSCRAPFYRLNNRRRPLRAGVRPPQAGRDAANRPRPDCSRCSTRFWTWRCRRRSSPRPPTTRSSSS